MYLHLRSNDGVVTGKLCLIDGIQDSSLAHKFLVGIEMAF